MNSYNVNIKTGGRAVALGHAVKDQYGQWRPTTKDDLVNDTGSTSSVGYGQHAEPAWSRKEREMTQRAANYYSGGKASAIERQLWEQIGGQYRGEFNANVERGLWQMNMSNDRTKQLAVDLFNQVANAPR